MKTKTILALALAAAAASCTGPGQRTAAAPGEVRNWAPTPPMGWNSWDCYGPTVEEHEVKANADFMAQHLKEFGWEYVVVDIRWFVENDKAGGYNQTDPRYVIDGHGRYMPAVNRFPSAADGRGFGPLADYVHSLGLKFGIHIMRGVPRVAVERRMPVLGADGITADRICSDRQLCQWLSDNYTVEADSAGAQEYYNSIFELYADWGVDFVKVDDLSRPYHKGEIEMIRRAIDRCGRPIVLSTSPGETPVAEAAHLYEHANMWRMVDDVWDTWPHIDHLFHVAARWTPFVRPGTWPDCDMIPLGHISIRGERGEPRQSRLTTDEQYSLMTLFTIMRSPLMFGGDLPTTDSLTIGMLTNREVLAMHAADRSSLDLSLRPDSTCCITSAAGDCVYIALFNLSGTEREVSLELSECNAVQGEFDNLWTGARVVNRDPAGLTLTRLSRTLRPHACELLRTRSLTD